jgi:manganese transport protein
MLLQREALLQRTRLLGPAFVAAVAYVDPGNVATNTQAGAAFGYSLLWVLVGATLIAGLVQYLSAKVGWLTGETLPGLVARRNHRLPRICYCGFRPSWLPWQPIWLRLSVAPLR